MNNSYILRPATESDLAAINDIYNHYVLHSTCTYQEEQESFESRREWFRNHREKHPVIVAVRDGQVVGWGSLSLIMNARLTATPLRTPFISIISISDTASALYCCKN